MPPLPSSAGTELLGIREIHFLFFYLHTRILNWFTFDQVHEKVRFAKEVKFIDLRSFDNHQATIHTKGKLLSCPKSL